MRGQIDLERDPVARRPSAGNDLFLDIRQNLAVKGQGLGNAGGLRLGSVDAGLHFRPSPSIAAYLRSQQFQVGRLWIQGLLRRYRHWKTIATHRCFTIRSTRFR